MKKILFLIADLECGGVQKSFVNMINTFDRDRYEIDVLVLRYRGLYLPLLPSNINIIHSEKMDMIFDYFPISIKRLLKQGFFLLAVGRIFQFLVSRFDRGYGGWLLSRMIMPISKKYDAVIDEGGQCLLYYMVDKIIAKKKISFFHNDYSVWNYYYSIDRRYYPRVDYVLTISDMCVNSMRKWFPNVDKDKIMLMENISSVKLIRQMSALPIDDIDKSSKLILCTLGRLAEQKGIDIAIESARILQDRSLNFIWYFIGDGEPKLKSYYDQLVHRYALQSHIVFLGERANPYPYVKLADIVVHPARYEGKSIALDEVKILCKPLVVTNFSTVNDQFENGYNATICEMTPEAVANSIMELLRNDDLRSCYISNLKANIRDNSDQINILYSLIDD